MRALSVAAAISGLEHNFIIRASAIVLGFGILLISLTFLVWGAFFQSQTKVLTGVNYYAQPIIVKYGSQQKQLNAFEQFSFTTSVFGIVKLEVTDLKGRILSTRSHELNRSASVIVDILSEGDLAKQCFVQANVTNQFYERSYVDSQVTDIKILTDKGTSSLTLEVPAVSETTLYPGTYAGQSLPPVLNSYQRVSGIYPVDCAALKDESKLATQIIRWSTTSADKQRDLYAEKIKEINNSPEYNH